MPITLQRLSVRTAAVIVACSLCVPTSTSADTVVLSPTKDNTLYESPGTLSNGAGTGMFAGRNSMATDSIRRAAMAFDIAGNIPASSTITSVSLQLRQTQGNSFNFDISTHRLLADWGESSSVAIFGNGGGGGGGPAVAGDATWLHTFSNTQFWTTNGGDFEPVGSATTTVASQGFYTWGSTPGMVADAQFWLDNSANNFGWILVGTETQGGTAKRFATREVANSADRPQLTIDFTPPGAPGACCIPLTGQCMTLSEIDCGNAGGVFQGSAVPCTPNPCPPPIPTVSQWGQVVIALLLLCAGTILYRRREDARKIGC